MTAEEFAQGTVVLDGETVLDTINEAVRLGCQDTRAEFPDLPLHKHFGIALGYLTGLARRSADS